MNVLISMHSAIAAASAPSDKGLSFSLIALAFICFLLSGFFSGMEAGVLTLNRERLRHYLNQGRRQARVLLDYLSQPADFLWTILTGNILFSFSALFALVVGFTSFAQQYPWLFLPGFFLVVLIYVSLFDLLPKTLFQRFPNRLCMHSVGTFRFISRVLRPLVWVVSHFGNLWLRPSRESLFFDNFYESREQIKNVLKDSSQLFTREEDSLISNVINLGDKHVSHWMRPIESSIRVAPNDPVHSVVEKCRQSGLNRLPVLTDHGTYFKAVGEVGLFPVLFEGMEDSESPVENFMQAPLVFPSDFTVHQALANLQKSGRRMAIIVGRDHEALGLVTLNDVVGILFGEVDI